MNSVRDTVYSLLNRTGRGTNDAIEEIGYQASLLVESLVWMCAGPAEIWHLKNKGKIQVGYDADLVLVDMNLQQMILNEQQQTKSRWSPWHGAELTGWPVATWVGGNRVYHLDDKQAIFDTTVLGAEIEFDSPG